MAILELYFKLQIRFKMMMILLLSFLQELETNKNRAISQDYSLNKDLRTVDCNSGLKRRKFGTSHHSLSDAGTSIMKQDEYKKNLIINKELNKSAQPGSNFLNLKSTKVGKSVISSLNFSFGDVQEYSRELKYVSQIGSAVSNASVPMTCIKDKEFKFYKYFSTNFPISEPISEKKKNGRSIFSNIPKISTKNYKEVQQLNLNLNEDIKLDSQTGVISNSYKKRAKKQK